MKQELDEALVKDFPNLYRDRNGDLRSTAMCWGFECGSGWESLLRELSGHLEKEILKLPEEHRNHVRASQVKEKYGTLRFYMSSETDEMSWFISEAENKSAITCELCGDKGSVRNDGWVTVRCNDCHLRSYLNSCVNAIVENVKQVEYEKYDGAKALKNTIDDKEENINGMVTDLNEMFNPKTKREKRTFNDIKESIIIWLDWKYYKVKSTIKNPKWLFDDIKRSIKYNIWKLKRKINGFLQS